MHDDAPAVPSRFKGHRGRRGALVVLLILAPAILAFTRQQPVLNWGLPDLLYQDETYLMEIVARMQDERSSLPHWQPGGSPVDKPFFEYGHLGLYAIKGAASRAQAAVIASEAGYGDEPLEPWRVASGARTIVMMFGLAMLVAVALAGRRALSVWEAFAASLILALSSDHFHYSVWAKPDLIGGALAAVALLAAVTAAARRWPALAVVAAVAAGLATAAKYNAGVLAGGALLAALFSARRVWSRIGWGAATAVAAVGGFAAGMPHAIGRWSEFWGYLTRRFLHGEQLADFGPVPALGPLGILRVPATALANTFVDANWAGILFLALFVAGAIRLGARRRPADIVVLAVSIVGLATTFPWLRRGFHHQLLPVMPAIALVVAAGIGGCWAGLRTARRFGSVRLPLTIAFGSLLFAAAGAGWIHISSIRDQLTDNSYVEQARWLEEHVPFGTRIGVEGHLGPFPRAGYEIYRAYSLGLNPVSFYRQERYAFLLVNTWIRDFTSFRPEIRAFYASLPGAATLVTTLPAPRTAFSYGGAMQVWRVHGVDLRTADGTTSAALENGDFERGLTGWDIRHLALDLSGDRLRRATTVRVSGPSGHALRTTVQPGGRAHIGQVLTQSTGRVRATVRVEGDVTAYLETRAYTETGAHLATRRYRLQGDCVCEPGSLTNPGEWKTLTVDLPSRVTVGDARFTKLVEIRFVVLDCEQCAGGSLAVDDVRFIAA